MVHKILGNAARAGKSLSEIKALADELVPQIHTVGLALSGATVPEVGKPGFILADDEIEFGIGIHGEPGYRKEKMQPSKDLAQELVAKLKDSFESMAWVQHRSWNNTSLPTMWLEFSQQQVWKLFTRN